MASDARSVSDALAVLYAESGMFFVGSQETEAEAQIIYTEGTWTFHLGGVDGEVDPTLRRLAMAWCIENGCRDPGFDPFFDFEFQGSPTEAEKVLRGAWSLIFPFSQMGDETTDIEEAPWGPPSGRPIPPPTAPSKQRSPQTDEKIFQLGCAAVALFFLYGTIHTIVNFAELTTWDCTGRVCRRWNPAVATFAIIGGFALVYGLLNFGFDIGRFFKPRPRVSEVSTDQSDAAQHPRDADEAPTESVREQD